MGDSNDYQQADVDEYGDCMFQDDDGGTPDDDKRDDEPILNPNEDNEGEQIPTNMAHLSEVETEKKVPNVLLGSIHEDTKSTAFVIYNGYGRPIASHKVELDESDQFEKSLQLDPYDILVRVEMCIEMAAKKAVEAGYSMNELKAIGITNQRGTAMVWNKTTGRPLHDAIAWMDDRSSSICRKLEEELAGGRNHFRESCGLPISTCFSATKFLWLMENVAAVRKAAKRKKALFGTIDTWLIWNLTGGSRSGLHVTDVSNASHTMLMNLRTLDWDEDTLQTLGISRETLPKIVSNSEIIGYVDRQWPVLGVLDIPIAGCLGDQHAAMLGQALRKGEAKSSYGASVFVHLNTGEEIVHSVQGLLSVVSFKLGPSAPINYALEGCAAMAGAAVEWLKDIGIIRTSNEIEKFASEVESTGGVYFVPAFNEMFTPWWGDDPRAACLGITRFTNKSHICRAVLESMCFQVKNVLDAMLEATNKEGEFQLKVDGSATVNTLLMQIQADLIGNLVVRPDDIETVALGAAYAAGLGVGVWSQDEIFSTEDKVKTVCMFYPTLEEGMRKKKLESWQKAVSTTSSLGSL